jgi:hypothetical protein
MSAQVKDLVGSDVWLNKLIKDPDRDVFEAERGEKDKDPEHIKPGFTPKHRKKGRKHV